MPEPAEELSPSERPDRPDGKAKPARSLTVFYVALAVVVALALFGFWFWRSRTVWWFEADEAGRRQAEAAARLGLPVETTVDLGGGVKLELVLVPAGRFKMGSPAKEAGRRDDEQQHWVTISRPFYMGKYEVTQEQWEKLMGKNPSAFKGPTNPVENVSWDDCQEFLKKLNALPLSPLPGEGEGPRVGGQFRLPTEAEWEWACRAGARTRFCSGDADESLAGVAWFDANSKSATHPVGEKKPNAWRLHDLHGNVSEGCGDWYGEYEGGDRAPVRDPAGPPIGSARVLRGGDWVIDPDLCRSATRITVAPTRRYSHVGFRVLAASAGP